MPRWGLYDLPGPSAFLDRIEEDLREGRSILLRINATAPPGFETELSRRVHEFSHWTPLTVDESPPESCLAACFLAEHDRKDLGFETLYDLEGFAGRTFILDMKTIGNLEHWLDFLPRYAEYSRPYDVRTRSSVILPIRKSLSGPLPDKDVLLRDHSFNGVVSKIDMHIFANQHFFASTGRDVLQELHINLCVELGLWDFSLCRRLANEALRTTCNPKDILMAYAAEMGFADLDPEDESALWHAGAVGSFDGKRMVHSAMLALQDDTEQLNYRVWTAQLRTLYPYVEEHRLQILKSYRSRISLPHFRPPDKTIHELSELEIGDIYANLRGKGRVDSKFHNFVKNIWMLRRDLAHLNRVDPELLSTRKITWTYPS